MVTRPIPKVALFAILLIFSIPNNLIAGDHFWVIKNIDATKARAREVGTALNTCQSGTKDYFDQTPSSMTIYLYGSRPSFVEGLQSEHGFSEQSASYFKDNSAPRPLNGTFLVPPDQDLRNICHEVIHHFLENNTDREHLLDAKWFDEGTASLLANIIFNPKKIEGMRHYLIEESKKNFIPIEKMQTEADWNKLHGQKGLRSISYLQAMFMVEYFFSKYHDAGFKELLAEMNRHTFEESFKAVSKTSQKKFYKDWKKQFIK